jgi:hypothetical protein
VMESAGQRLDRAASPNRLHHLRPGSSSRMEPEPASWLPPGHSLHHDSSSHWFHSHHRRRQRPLIHTRQSCRLWMGRTVLYKNSRCALRWPHGRPRKLANDEPKPSRPFENLSDKPLQTAQRRRILESAWPTQSPSTPRQKCPLHVSATFFPPKAVRAADRRFTSSHSAM